MLARKNLPDCQAGYSGAFPVDAIPVTRAAVGPNLRYRKFVQGMRFKCDSG